MHRLVDDANFVYVGETLGWVDGNGVSTDLFSSFSSVVGVPGMSEGLIYSLLLLPPYLKWFERLLISACSADLCGRLHLSPDFTGSDLLSCRMPPPFSWLRGAPAHRRQ